ncbi:MAG: cell wall hydrolase [Peptococcia bacterium]
MKKRKIITSAILTLVLMFTFTMPAWAVIHVVKRGESLYKISRRYGTTIADIKTINNLSGNTIYPGQKLEVGEKSTPHTSRGSVAISQDDLYWLARAVHGEARGESYTGKVAVAAVILNRVRHKDFPNTVKGVIFEPLAFTCVADGQIYLQPDNSAFQAARAAMGGEDPSGGALYYWNPAKATSKWIWSRPIIKTIGNHVFAK